MWITLTSIGATYSPRSILACSSSSIRRASANIPGESVGVAEEAGFVKTNVIGAIVRKLRQRLVVAALTQVRARQSPVRHVELRRHFQGLEEIGNCILVLSEPEIVAADVRRHWWRQRIEVVSVAHGDETFLHAARGGQVSRIPAVAPGIFGIQLNGLPKVLLCPGPIVIVPHHAPSHRRMRLGEGAVEREGP